MGSHLAALVRTLWLNQVYLPSYATLMKLDLDVIKHLGMADTTALVDSGATENFIDY